MQYTTVRTLKKGSTCLSQSPVSADECPPTFDHIVLHLHGVYVAEYLVFHIIKTTHYFSLLTVLLECLAHSLSEKTLIISPVIWFPSICKSSVDTMHEFTHLLLPNITIKDLQHSVKSWCNWIWIIKKNWSLLHK